MARQIPKTVCAGFARGVLILSCIGIVSPLRAQEDQLSVEENSAQCSVELTRPGAMKDIVSNALTRGLNRHEPDVKTFLQGAETRYATGQKLLAAAAVHFEINEADLTAEVEKFKHCNCEHGPLADNPGETGPGPEDANSQFSKFAQDVTLHVVLHELGHALIREFDLPILGNEETMADAFATWYLTTQMPDRALEVLRARIRSLMVEAGEVPREQWDVSGEHNNDARRAFQIAALAIADDAEKYNALAREIGMSDDDIANSRDYGTEIHRSWRRAMEPLWMPEGVVSGETRVKHDPQCPVARQLNSNGLTKELKSIIERFDWHSQITIHFASGDGGAGWSRSTRTITVHSEYIRRFIRQGAVANSDGTN